MNLKPIVALAALAASLAAFQQTEAHGGLMIPPCRNNHENTNVFNFTPPTSERFMSGGSCAGDMCLWFNDGCFIGCPNCTSVVSVLPGASGEVPDRFIKVNGELHLPSSTGQPPPSHHHAHPNARTSAHAAMHASAARFTHSM